MKEEINKKYLKEKQYKSTKYLEARIKIHQFTKNKIGFHEWIFSQYDLSEFEKNNETFRIINALKPGTFDDETETFAIVLVADLVKVNQPLLTVKSMIDIAAIFSENFYSSMYNQDRTPFTKQMISHIESRAQEIERIRQLPVNSLEK